MSGPYDDGSRSPSGPTHPRLKASLLVGGVLLLIVLLSLSSL